jgi:hypothetical protein
MRCVVYLAPFALILWTIQKMITNPKRGADMCDEPVKYAKWGLDEDWGAFKITDKKGGEHIYSCSTCSVNTTRLGLYVRSRADGSRGKRIAFFKDKDWVSIDRVPMKESLHITNRGREGSENEGYFCQRDLETREASITMKSIGDICELSSIIRLGLEHSSPFSDYSDVRDLLQWLKDQRQLFCTKG